MLQFEAFARGFMMLCGGPAIHLFSATELERLVCGNPLLDFDAMQANARYDGGYSPEHRVSHSSALYGITTCIMAPDNRQLCVVCCPLLQKLHAQVAAIFLRMIRTVK